MGNAAAKQLDETELGVGTITQDDGKAIVKTLVTADEGTTKMKSKGKTWIKYTEEEQTLLWSYQHVGMIKCHSVVSDATGKPVAIIFKVSKGISFSSTSYICRSVPSYDGQEPLTNEELEKVGVKDTGGESLYQFAKIECSKKLSTATCTYDVVTGKDTTKTLFEGEKLASMSFRAIFKETGGAVIAKAYMPGMSMTPHMDVASGVDMLAVVSMGYALAGDASSAGALAGAGVV